MHGLSIYEIKKICHHAQFFIISYRSFQHLTNFLTNEIIISPKYQTKIVVIFLLNLIIVHDLKSVLKMCKFICYPKP